MDKYNIDLKILLRKRFFLLLSIVCGMFFVVIGANLYILREEDSMLSSVNISGRQRMLSQRIVMLSAELVYDLQKNKKNVSAQANQDHFSNVLDELKTSYALMSNSHKVLLYGDKNFNVMPPFVALSEHYFVGENALQIKANVFFENIQKIIKLSDIYLIEKQLSDQQIEKIVDAYNQSYQLAISPFLKSLDQAVHMYEKNGRDSVSTVNFVQMSLFIFILMSIFLMRRYVLTPMEDVVDQRTRALDNLRHFHRRQRHRFDLALKGSSTGIWDWDIRSEGVYFNEGMKKILGLESDVEDQYDFLYLKSLMSYDDQDRFDLLIAKHWEGREHFSIICQMTKRGGEIIWVKIQGEASFDEDEEPYRMVGSIEDISMQKKYEDQKQIMISGIEASNVAFAIVDLHDKDRNFMFASEAFANLSGYSQDMLTQKNMSIFSGPETDMIHLNHIDYAFNEKKPLSLKTLSYRADGSSFWNQITINPVILDKDQEVQYCTIVFEDLTLAILREKREITRQRNESLGSVAGSVAHEINNLLMPMSMSKDILQDELREDCDPFAREHLDMIEQYTHQARDIVSGILTFSRQETAEVSQCVIKDELDEAVKFIKGLKGPKTKLDFENFEDHDVFSDAKMNSVEFKQIITNLFKNAEYAFDGKDGEIKISASIKSLNIEQRKDLDVSAYDFYVIDVADNGCGIEPDIIEKIFEPLYTTKDIGEGTGLGLSIVQGILKSWGGAIDVSSQKGEGTTFTLYIPVYKDDNDFSDLVDLV